MNYENSVQRKGLEVVNCDLMSSELDSGLAVLSW